MSSIVAEPKSENQTIETGYTLREQLLAFSELLLLGLWIGAMCFFSFAVAQSAFAVLPSRHLAGMIVGSTLTKLEWIGLGFGALLFVIQFFKERRKGKAFDLSFVLLILMLAVTVALRFWVSPAMNALHLSMGGAIDDISPADPLRVQFNNLHQYSVMLMGFTILAGVAAFFLNIRSWLRRV